MRNWQLKSHKNLEHKTTISKVSSYLSQCFVCLKTFTKPGMLARHKRLQHKSQLEITCKWGITTNDINKLCLSSSSSKGAIPEFKCNFCPVVKDKPSVLALHEAEKHPRQYTITTHKLTNKSNRPRCPSEYTLKRFYIKHFLQAHLNLLTSESHSACKICSRGKVYIENSESHFIKCHRIDDGVEPQNCDKCQAYFRKLGQL